MHIVYMSKGKMQGSIPLMGFVCELHYVGFIFSSDIIIIIIILIFPCFYFICIYFYASTLLFVIHFHVCLFPPFII